MDLALKWALAAAVAALMTRRVTPGNAAAAHRVWLAVLLAPVLWAVGEWTLSPVAYLRFRPDVLPQILTTPAPDARTAALVAYATIATALLLRTLTGVRAVYRLIRSTSPIPSADRATIERLIGPAADRVREGSLEVPVTAGFVRPLIVLPAGWRSMSHERLAAILHHEAGHVRRRDCAVSLGCAVIEALFWFHPAAWIAASRVRWFAEMACDAEAAQAMDDRDYAEALLSLAAAWTSTKRPRYAVMAGAETGVAARIRLLLDEMEQGRRRRRLLPVAALLVLIGVPLAAALRVGGPSEAGAWTGMHAHADHGTMHGH